MRCSDAILLVVVMRAVVEESDNDRSLLKGYEVDVVCKITSKFLNWKFVSKPTWGN